MADDSSERFVLLNHLADEFAARYRPRRTAIRAGVIARLPLADEIRGTSGLAEMSRSGRPPVRLPSQRCRTQRSERRAAPERRAIARLRRWRSSLTCSSRPRPGSTRGCRQPLGAERCTPARMAVRRAGNARANSSARWLSSTKAVGAVIGHPMSPYLHTCADRHIWTPGPSFSVQEAQATLPELIPRLAPGEEVLLIETTPGSEAGRGRAASPAIPNARRPRGSVLYMAPMWYDGSLHAAF